MKTYTAADVRELLALQCLKAGGQAAWARKHSITRAYVNQVILGKREPTACITVPLGLTTVKTIVWTVDEGENVA